MAYNATLSPKLLREIEILCEETLIKAMRGIERKVFVCNFAQLQFPVSQQLRAYNHYPVRTCRV